MRKIIFILVFITIFLFLFKFNVKAQYSDILIPGVNCGVAGNIKTNKCCSANNWSPISLPDFGSPFKALQDAATWLGKKMISSFTSKYQSYLATLVIPCQIGEKSTSDPADVNCRCLLAATPTPGPITALNKFCENQSSSHDKTGCQNCIQGGGVWTGIGCVQGSLDKFVSQTLLGWGIGLAGGLSLLCIIYAAFMMQSSQGNPEKLKKAQELITSCIMGLMLIIFSIFILRLIGVNILKIPGFG